MADQDTGVAELVRERYAKAANQARSGQAPCCDDGSSPDPVTGGIYQTADTEGLPEKAILASLGCGNPTALIDLQPGSVVLDLGSGGGIDVLLSARRVGPEGFVYGLDMTDEMLALALENKAKAGATNVAFLRGTMEDIPLPANSVDVVISNCVINLAADKSLVLSDAFRVLKPGGRFAVADVVAEGDLPDGFRQNMEAWVGCLAGALPIDEYRSLLEVAGFEDVSFEILRRYTADESGIDLPEAEASFDGKLASAFVRASKPLVSQEPSAAPQVETEAACGSGCCR